MNGNLNGTTGVLSGVSCAKLRFFVHTITKARRIFFNAQVFLCHKRPETCSTCKAGWWLPV